MTRDKTQRLRELAQKATPGPWVRVFTDKKELRKFRTKSGRPPRVVASAMAGTKHSDVPAPMVECVMPGVDGHGVIKLTPDADADVFAFDADNMTYIAAANPSTVLALLDELERTRGTVDIVSSALFDAEKKVAKLRTIESAARNLANVKGRHNSEIAMNQLLETLK